MHSNVTRMIALTAAVSFTLLCASAFLSVLLLPLIAVACSAPASDKSVAETIAVSYANPRPVTIRGYSGDAMEPFITRDGAYLFFNNSNDPSVDTNLHWSRRVNDLTFEYLGEVAGVNSTALDAVASMDEAGTFYFVSSHDYARTFLLVFRGPFSDGVITAVEPVAGIARGRSPYANFDAEINATGDTLYYVDGSIVPSRDLPETADILVAHRDGAGFRPERSTAWIMEEVNSGALEYAPATSADGLTLFFTRLRRLAGIVPIHVGIYVTTRDRVGAPFGRPALIRAADGFVEAPTVAPDGSLYYHRKDSGRFVIYRLAQEPPVPVEER